MQPFIRPRALSTAAHSRNGALAGERAGERPSFSLRSVQSARGAAWGFLDLADLIAPTDPMTDLFDKSRPRRPGSPDSARVIAIRGAREHNLKNIDLEIPRDQRSEERRVGKRARSRRER